MKIPQVNRLSRASQLSLLAIVILLGAVFFTVNNALLQQKQASHASYVGIQSGHVYRFLNRCSNQAMDVQNNSMSNSAHIIQWPWASSGSNNNREWLVTSLGNGYYSIRAVSSYKYLDVAGDSKSSGAQIVQYLGSGSPYGDEQWKIVALSNGYYKIVGKNSGMAIGLYSCSSSNGLNIRQYSYSGQERLQWKVDEISYATPKPWVSVPSCINPGYAGSGVKVSWSNAGVSYVDIGTDSSFPIAKYFNKHVSGQSTTAPSGFDLDHYDTTKFTMNPKTTYYVRTWDGLFHSHEASFSIPACSSTPQPSSPPPPSNGNLLKNPSFESGTTDWTFYKNSPASGTFSTTTATAENGVSSALVNITGSSSNVWYIQLYQTNLPMQAGQKYTVSFWAKASVSRQINSLVQFAKSPYTNYIFKTFNLTNSWQHYSYTFTPNVSQSDTAIVFDLAQKTGQVWIDNVSYSVGGTPSPSSAPSAAPSVAPSSAPSAAPSVAPSSAPSNSPSSSPSPVPTVSYAPGSTLINFIVGLQGIGTAGDSANPHSDGNMHPLRPHRAVTVDMYNASNQLVLSQHGTVSYDSSTGKFNGTINLGNNFTTGLYTVKIKADQYLRSLVPGIQTITAGQTTTLPEVSLVAGDINGDNAINIVDYNILIGCYSDLLPPVSCNATNNVLSDLNDDGHVNQFDYNLFLRELSNLSGQ